MNYIFDSSNDILEKVTEGDLLRIEYYSIRLNKRVIRLFEVTTIIQDRHIIQLENSRMTFTITDQAFIEDEYSPKIISWIKKEDIESIELKVLDENMNFDNMYKIINNTNSRKRKK